jgi:hypothetical protein
MAGVGAPWAGHGELAGEGRGRGRGGRCWEAPWGAARALGAGCGPAAACVHALCCSWTMLIVRREEEEGERRGKTKGRKRKRKKGKNMENFPNLKISEK